MIHNITIRVFARATEDESRVKSTLSFFTGDIDIERIVTEGHYGNTIVILQSSVQGKDSKGLMEHIKAVMDKNDVQRVLSELYERVDDEGYLHLKFDKQAAYIGKAILAANPDGIALKIKLKAFPARRDVAVKTARMLFEEGLY